MEASRFLDFDLNRVRAIINTMNKVSLMEFLGFIMDNINIDIGVPIDIELRDRKKWAFIRVSVFKSAIEQILSLPNYRAKIHLLLGSDDLISTLYFHIIWENTQAWFDKANLKKFGIKEIQAKKTWGEEIKVLEGKKALIKQKARFSYRGKEAEFLYVDPDIREILKFFVEVPKQYYIEASKPKECEYNYSNEEGIFSFIHTFVEMYHNSVLEFSKNGEKPLQKTLNILKSSTQTEEFYEEKPNHLLATDMLSRSFWSAYNAFRSPLDTKDEKSIIKSFIDNKFADKYEFFITRFFTTHLRGVRFDPAYSSEKGLFDIAKEVVKEMPQDSWVDMKNVILFCKYRELIFLLEPYYKTMNYEFHGIFVTNNGEKLEDFYDLRGTYMLLFLAPTLKGLFFYLAALGLFEIRYNQPKTDCVFKKTDKPYISLWDSLESFRLTEFGKYVFGISKNYTPKEIKISKKDVKFDEYKPIITLDPNDTITIAKIDAFCEKLDDGRYILSYSKIFKDCSNYKSLELKIDGFYNIFNIDVPDVFKEYLNGIKKRSNLLRRDLKMITIELEEYPELLNLFATNKKLQELITKAQGYRILVKKENIPKLRKILGDNGFYIDF